MRPAHPSPPRHARLLVALLALASQGCSFIFVDAPPPNTFRDRGEEPTLRFGELLRDLRRRGT